MALEEILKVRTWCSPAWFLGSARYVQRKVAHASLAVAVDAAPGVSWCVKSRNAGAVVVAVTVS